MLRHTRFVLVAAAALGACSPGDEPPPEPSPSASAMPVPSASAGPGFRYTSLADCPVIESSPDEGGYYEAECAGAGGYRLRVIEGDLRQSVTVIAPDGTSTALDLAAVTGGGFSTLGETAEWRGRGEGEALAPDALILRHDVVTDPEGQRTTSYLVAVRLAGTPCVTARIDPGPGQNEAARAAADAGGSCLR